MDAITEKAFIKDDIGKPTTEESPSLLTIILDTNPTLWNQISNKFTLKSMIESLVIAINAHLALNNANQVAVIASHSDGARFFYPYKAKQQHSDQEQQERQDQPITQMENQQDSDGDNRSASPEIVAEKEKTKYVNHQMYRQFRLVDETFIESLFELFNGPIPNKPPQNSLSSSLTLALTYINKQQLLNSVLKARILVVNISPDEHLKYIPVMNSIFAAQKMKIPIDVCQIINDSTFLQQASDATNGVYLHIENLAGLIQYLTTTFFIDPSLRNILITPTSGNIDFRASCFLTGKVVDIGYVCSVCLCILSSIPKDNKCPACDSEFDNHVLMKLKKKPVVVKTKKKKRKLNDTPTPGVTPSPHV
ncbi:hypothetical protein WICMUC_001916 [Wickerhamomyces mucosus]|uniref:General transcription and DNA repair factor IIH subunit TFB4 n=1 Tax=Wickerhamomyces mucosus TaxID=1378264 RepID=A0A9P8PSY0_9ASCO|nr:hypothetical protein WICMUC_001916 [Wickerhamomyces mucosus]